MLKEIQNLFGKNTSPQNGPLRAQTILRELQKKNRQVWQGLCSKFRNIWKNRKKLLKEKKTYRCSFGHSVCNSDNLHETLAESPKKMRLIPKIFLLFSYRQKLFYRTSLRDTIWQTASVCSEKKKNLSFEPGNIYKKQKIFQMKPSFSAKFSSGTVGSWFEIPKEICVRSIEILSQLLFFDIFFRKKVASNCSSGHVDCSLDQFSWIFNEKNSSIISQYF